MIYVIYTWWLVVVVTILGKMYEHVVKGVLIFLGKYTKQ